MNDIIITPCGLQYVENGLNVLEPYMQLNNHLHWCHRYGKFILLKSGDTSDGATGAFDIVSCGWWVHDKLCKEGKWSDGTPLTNYQCSQVLYDILWSEGRYFRALYWKWSTFLLGGGKARENGMLRLKNVS